MRIELTRAITYKDTELKDIELDLESITGYQLIEAEEELRKQGIMINTWDMSRPFLIQIAGKASHIPVEVLKSMSASDFNRVCNVCAGFLLGTGTEELTRISTVK
ncbi:MAG: phage tail assembly protein [Synergistaceae bacterium]|nr:phage tail assembly protein [Synergistaceae bacterium]